MKLLNLVLVLLLVSTAINVHAQADCQGLIDMDYKETGKKDSDSGAACDRQSTAFANRWGLQDSYIPDIDQLSDTPLKIVKVNLHVMQQEAPLPPGNFEEDNPDHVQFLNDLIDVAVNGLYRSPGAPSDPITCACGTECHIPDTRIEFEIQEIYYHQDNDGYDVGCSTRNYNIYKTNPDSEINIFFHGIIPNQGGGCANTPSFFLNRNLFIIMVSSFNRYLLDPSTALHPLGVNLAHELGHNLGLFHTYQPTCCPESCDESSHDYLDDVFGSSSNSCGQTCYHDNGWGCDVNSPDNSCSNNMMGGTAAAGYFSPKQIGRMHRELSLKSARKYVSCIEPVSNYIVDSDETWDFDIRLYRNIIVKSGATLTLTCRLEMPRNAKIIVERGGKLVLDAATVTKSCDDKWGGIEVWGVASSPQPEIKDILDGNYPGGPADQGVVVIRNGSVIEHAKNAVALSKRNCGEGCHDLAYTGGVVYAENSTFLNNWRSAEFMKYETDASASKFIGTNHILDEFFPAGTSSPKVHISSWDVYDIEVANCSFKDTRQIDTPRPNGLYTIDGSFQVSFSNFENVDTAITIQKETLIPGNVAINENTTKGFNQFVFAQGVSNLTVSNNLLNSINSGVTGIEVVDCISSSIMDNDITGRDMLTNGIIYHSNEQFGHLVRRNSISDVENAVVVKGDNGGLKILCNQFYSNDFDIRVENLGTEPGEIYVNQGQNNDPAGNLFSAKCEFQGTHIYTQNGSTLFNYYHHNPKAYKPLCVEGSVNVVETGIVFNPDIHCLPLPDCPPKQDCAQRLANDSEQSSSSVINVYPNPVLNGQLVIEIIDDKHLVDEKYLITLNSFLGKGTHVETLNGPRGLIDISGLPNGIYILNISKDEVMIQSEKVLIIN